MRKTSELSEATLMRMATFYLARHSASTKRLREVLSRKIIRRLGPNGERPEDSTLQAMVEPVIDRLRRAGLVDDAAYARGRVASLATKGRSVQRIRADLSHAGVDTAADLDGLLTGLDPLEQATIWARRRRLGPYRPGDRAARRDRDLASMARAGFSLAIAKLVIDKAAEDLDV